MSELHGRNAHNRRRLGAVLGLTSGFLLVEVVGGLLTCTLGRSRRGCTP